MEEDKGKPAAEPSETVAYWIKHLDASANYHLPWYEQAKQVNSRYLDEKRDKETGSATNVHKMNVLWSNIETTKPALYAKTATPKVQRRYKDKDPVGRWAAIVMERALSYSLDAPGYDPDYEIRNAVSDYLLPGRGVTWEFYEPTIKKNADGGEYIAWESTYCRHIHWRDFLTSPARTWSEVWWVAIRAFLSREAAEARFGKKVADGLTYDSEPDADKDRAGERDKKAEVWEIWCKLDGKRYFISKSYKDGPLEPPAPPKLDLEGFWPCPRPITGTTTTDSILPVPDFIQYADQAREIDRLTQKINVLTKAIRVAGLFDATIKGLEDLLDETNANRMIACENWQLFSQKGGIDGTVQFFPLQQIVAALKACYEAREAAKQTMYEVNGLSDILRGASDPNETLGAQQIKTQWGGLRIRDRQKEVQRFVRDGLRIRAEIIAERYQQSTLRTMTNVPLLTEAEKADLLRRQAALAAAAAAPPPQQGLMGMAQGLVQRFVPPAPPPVPLTPDELQKLREPTWEQVIKLLRESKLRGFRIDIETDSTVQADEQAEKAARVEFTKAVTEFMVAAYPIIQAAPGAAKMLSEMLLFTVRGFKAGETLESAIEEAQDELQQATAARSPAATPSAAPPPGVPAEQMGAPPMPPPVPQMGPAPVLS